MSDYPRGQMQKAAPRYARRARPARPTPVRVDHLASKWSTNTGAVLSAVRRSVRGVWTEDEWRAGGAFQQGRITRDELDELLDPADVIGLTEIASKNRGNVVDDVDDWTGVRGPDGPFGEVGFMFRDAAWRPLGHECVELGPDLGPGDLIVAIIVAAVHVETGARALFIDKHLPADVESSWRAMTRRVRAHIAAGRVERERIRAWRRRVKPNAIVSLGDWNVDALKAWVRAMLRAEWVGWGFGDLDDVGTHGAGKGRLIDFALLRGVRRAVQRVLPRHRHSDHRGIRVRGMIRKARRA